MLRCSGSHLLQVHRDAQAGQVQGSEQERGVLVTPAGGHLKLLNNTGHEIQTAVWLLCFRYCIYSILENHSA